MVRQKGSSLQKRRTGQRGGRGVGEQGLGCCCAPSLLLLFLTAHIVSIFSVLSSLHPVRLPVPSQSAAHSRKLPVVFLYNHVDTSVCSLSTHTLSQLLSSLRATSHYPRKNLALGHSPTPFITLSKSVVPLYITCTVLYFMLV